MKNWKYIHILLLLLVVYSAGGTPVIANSTTAPSAQIQGVDDGVNPSEKGVLFFEEVSISAERAPSLENKFHSFRSGFSNATTGFSNTRVYHKFEYSFSLQDKRKLIAAVIFPYHFFW